MPFFNAEHLQSPSNQYVCWIDIMGTMNKMSSSINSCANFVFKLHSAIIENISDKISLYPVMDGAYITSSSQKVITKFLTSVFYSITKMFIEEKNPYHRFLVKASLAFGPVFHGKDLPSDANNQFDTYPEYKNSILLGLPMVQAYMNEKNAPPFGVFVHESARAFAPTGDTPFTFKWWEWNRFISDLDTTGKNAYRKQLYDEINNYFEWAAKNTIALDYHSDRIAEHKKMAQEYFNTEPGVPQKSSKGKIATL